MRNLRARFVVHLNESARRKSGCVDLEPVYIYIIISTKE